MSKQPEVLLSTVFGPFGEKNRFNTKDGDKFLDYFTNRLTRESGPFALHDTHPTLAPHLIASNLNSVNTTVLETPTLDEYISEIKKGYHVIGISFLTLHLPKVIHMVALARKYSPDTKVVIGGFGTALHNLEEIGADAICEGEGIGFMRKYLNEPPDAPIVHPLVTMGLHLRESIMNPSLGSHRVGLICCGFGCPHKCEFCTTSAFYAGRHLPFVHSGDQLFELMQRYHQELGVADFILYEEDFFLYRGFIEEFKSRVAQELSPFSFGCYSTIKAISEYEIRDLVAMGLSHIWVGVESANSPFNKSQGRPAKELFDDLNSHGITTTASIIAGLDNHTKENIWQEFDHLVSLFPSTVQISNLIAGSGTKLRKRLQGEGRLLPVDVRDAHLYGEFVSHPEFGQGEIRDLIFKGYDYVYQELGPALGRILSTYFSGWKNLSKINDPQIKLRADGLRNRIAVLVPFFIQTTDLLPNENVRHNISQLLDSIKASLGSWNEEQQQMAQRFREVLSGPEISGPRNMFEPKTRITKYFPSEDKFAIVSGASKANPKNPTNQLIQINVNNDNN